jgi:hypothetical protein
LRHGRCAPRLRALWAETTRTRPRPPAVGGSRDRRPSTCYRRARPPSEGRNVTTRPRLVTSSANRSTSRAPSPRPQARRPTMDGGTVEGRTSSHRTHPPVRTVRKRPRPSHRHICRLRFFRSPYASHSVAAIANAPSPELTSEVAGRNRDCEWTAGTLRSFVSTQQLSLDVERLARAGIVARHPRFQSIALAPRSRRAPRSI